MRWSKLLCAPQLGTEWVKASGLLRQGCHWAVSWSLSHSSRKKRRETRKWHDWNSSSSQLMYTERGTGQVWLIPTTLHLPCALPTGGAGLEWHAAGFGWERTGSNQVEHFDKCLSCRERSFQRVMETKRTVLLVPDNLSENTSCAKLIKPGTGRSTSCKIISLHIASKHF